MIAANGPALLAWLARVALGAVLIFSGAEKLRDLDAFVMAAVDFHVLDQRIVVRLARMLPGVEIGLGIALVLGVAPNVMIIAALAVLSVFAAAVIVNIRRGRAIACHCFGAASHDVVGPATLVRIGVLATLAVYAGFAQRSGVDSRAVLSNLSASDWGAMASILASIVVMILMIGPADVIARMFIATRRSATARRRREARLAASALSVGVEGSP